MLAAISQEEVVVTLPRKEDAEARGLNIRRISLVLSLSEKITPRLFCYDQLDKPLVAESGLALTLF
jgi:hypothetical protein